MIFNNLLRIALINFFALISSISCAQDHSIKLFENKLINAIHTNDTTFIFNHVDENVFNGFGYNSGIKAFKRIWQEPYPNIGEEIIKALEIGTMTDKESNRVYAPCFWLTFPDSLDAFEYVYVLEDNVPAYTQPDTNAAISDSLSKGLMKVLSRKVSDEYKAFGGPVWLGLKSETGDTLMVQSRYLRSPVDYRFWFEKKAGQWLLTGWAAGD